MTFALGEGVRVGTEPYPLNIQNLRPLTWPYPPTIKVTHRKTNILSFSSQEVTSFGFQIHNSGTELNEIPYDDGSDVPSKGSFSGEAVHLQSLSNFNVYKTDDSRSEFEGWAEKNGHDAEEASDCGCSGWRCFS